MPISENSYLGSFQRKPKISMPPYWKVGVSKMAMNGLIFDLRSHFITFYKFMEQNKCAYQIQHTKIFEIANFQYNQLTFVLLCCVIWSSCGKLPIRTYVMWISYVRQLTLNCDVLEFPPFHSTGGQVQKGCMLIKNECTKYLFTAICGYSLFTLCNV